MRLSMFHQTKFLSLFLLKLSKTKKKNVSVLDGRIGIGIVKLSDKSNFYEFT